MNTILICSKLITETSIIVGFTVFKISFETWLSQKLGGEEEKKNVVWVPEKLKTSQHSSLPYFHKQQILVQPLIYKRISQVRQNI